MKKITTYFVLAICSAFPTNILADEILAGNWACEIKEACFLDSPYCDPSIRASIRLEFDTGSKSLTILTTDREQPEVFNYVGKAIFKSHYSTLDDLGFYIATFDEQFNYLTVTMHRNTHIDASQDHRTFTGPCEETE